MCHSPSTSTVASNGIGRKPIKEIPVSTVHLLYVLEQLRRMIHTERAMWAVIFNDIAVLSGNV